MYSSTTAVESFYLFNFSLKRKKKSPWCLHLPVFFCTFLLFLSSSFCYPSVRPIIFRLWGGPALLWFLMNNSVSHSCYYRLIELDTSSLQLMPRHVSHLFVTIGGTKNIVRRFIVVGRLKASSARRGRLFSPTSRKDGSQNSAGRVGLPAASAHGDLRGR